MYKEHILNEFQNNTQIIYLDSSCLIRHYPLSILSKNFTRVKYTSNPTNFINTLNYFICPLYTPSLLLQHIIKQIVAHADNFHVITLDTMFTKANGDKIYNLFGSLNCSYPISTINSSVILFRENISVEAFFKASTLIRSANLIIIDDFFLSLSVGKQLLDRKKSETTTVTLSSIIGYSAYNTKEVLDIFNYFYQYLL